MRLLKRLLGWFYEHAIWRWTAGRPLTYVIREWTTRHPLWAALLVGSLTVAFVAGQVGLTVLFGLKALSFVLFADFLAFTAGHLFWDTAGAYIRRKEDFR